MLFKICISAVIIGCTSSLGIIYANTFVERTRFLSNLIYALQILETEIVYTNTPLPEVLIKTANKTSSEITRIFENTANILLRKEGYIFSEAWKKAIDESNNIKKINQEDKELLISLGNGLGISNTQDQIKHIDLVRAGIKRNYESSLISQKKNTRLYKNLGLLLGLTIVVIFF